VCYLQPRREDCRQKLGWRLKLLLRALCPWPVELPLAPSFSSGDRLRGAAVIGTAPTASIRLSAAAAADGDALLDRSRIRGGAA